MAQVKLRKVRTRVERPVRLLLVDDYADALEMWSLYLRFCGYEVLTASDGLSAIRIANDSRPDLVILDLDLPGISGIEAARRLRLQPRTAHIPILAATGRSTVARPSEAQALGFDAVLTKPCEPSELVREVEHVLEANKVRAAPR